MWWGVQAYLKLSVLLIEDLLNPPFNEADPTKNYSKNDC